MEYVQRCIKKGELTEFNNLMGELFKGRNQSESQDVGPECFFK